MKFSHLISFTHICYLTVDYDVIRMFHAHFSHFNLTTFDSFKLSVRTLHDFDLNEAIDVYDSTDVYGFIA